MNLYIKKSVRLYFENSAEVTEYYRALQIDYPKFFKMDGLSKLGFLASEMIFRDDEKRFEPCENIAVICFNRSSSLDTDMRYQETIRDSENYFPSPALFVYTLPNIVTGEIAIRNRLFGETCFYICKDFDAKQIARTVRNAFCDRTTTTVLAMWLECFEAKCEAVSALVENGEDSGEDLESQLSRLYYS